MKKTPPKSGSRSRNGTTSSLPMPVTIAAIGESRDGALNDIHARISVLAYSLFEQRGREHGHHMEDWLAAEQRILAAHS